MGFTEFYRVFLGFIDLVTGSTHRILALTRFYWVFIELSLKNLQVLPVWNRFYWF